MSAARVAERVAVIGAGIVGLSTAWHLQSLGAKVTVFEEKSPGAGASHGNAGWITPDLVEALPSPAVLRHGLFDLIRPNSPVTVADLKPETLRFLGAFARSCTRRRWRNASRALQWLSKQALDAYDELAEHVSEPTTRAPILTVFSNRAAAHDFIASHSHAAHRITLVSPQHAREMEPALSDGVGAAAVVEAQRYTNPHQFTAGLAKAFLELGGHLRTGARVTTIQPTGTGVDLRLAGPHADSLEFYDAVVVAAGIESKALVRDVGVKLPLVAGRGYSFAIKHPDTAQIPVYLPEHRLACTPLAEGYRVVGVMEFGGHGRPGRESRIDNMCNAIRPFLANGRDAIEPTHQWVGSRPCTPDGLPLIGATSSPRVHLATGHGMWGVTLGPITGRLVARSVLGHSQQAAIDAFSPLR